MRIVFAHLGNSNSDYMWANIQYLSKLAPNLMIDVITSKEAEESIEKLWSPNVSLFRYSPSNPTEEILSSLNIDSSYRDGFWRYSLERLIALAEHHKNFPDESLLHIESDVLLLKTFPFDAFESIQKVAWSSFEHDRDVASLIYLPNCESSSWLHSQMLKFLQENLATDDMHLLSLLSKTYETDILSLPIAPTADSTGFSSTIVASEHERVRCSEHSGKFAGVFDAAAIGIWLTGTHPVNSFGFSKRYDSNLLYKAKSYLDPSKIRFELSSDGSLCWSENGRRVNVHTLHVHSKNLDFFSKQSLRNLEKCVNESRKGRVITHFSLVVLIRLIQDNWKKGTLLRFLSWLPLIRNMKVIWNKSRKVD